MHDLEDRAGRPPLRRAIIALVGAACLLGGCAVPASVPASAGATTATAVDAGVSRRVDSRTWQDAALTADGFGPMRLGMTSTALVEAGHLRLLRAGVDAAGAADHRCDVLGPGEEAARQGVRAWFSDGVLTSLALDADSAGATLEGARPGMSVDILRALMGERLTSATVRFAGREEEALVVRGEATELVFLLTADNTTVRLVVAHSLDTNELGPKPNDRCGI